MRTKPILLLSVVILVVLLGYRFYISSDNDSSAIPPPLTDQLVQADASTPALDVQKATVLMDNDTTFTTKLEMIQTAKESIDLAYYIYADDHSSSILSQALIAAAKRGVQVRLLVDYQSTYAHFDLFSMLEQYGNQGKGSLQVRFYNRPSLAIIKDAVFLTLGCGDVGKQLDLANCSDEKYRAIEQQFATAAQNANNKTNVLLNYNNGQSGLFLSGFYAKNPRVMAMAIQQGQALSLSSLATSATQSDEETRSDGNNDSSNSAKKSKQLKQLSKAVDIYITARHGDGFEQVTASLKLKLAMMFLSGKINPYYDALTSYFPIGRDEPRAESLRDWNYITDYLHQKLLLVDGKRFVLGGRNVEDTYHMQANTLMEQYQFMDTDVSVELNTKENRLVDAFERLWHFQAMVATTKDVEQHAPNDMIAATLQAEEKCAPIKEHQAGFQSCYDLVSKHALNKAVRIQQAYDIMLTNVAKYTIDYRQTASARSAQQPLSAPEFIVDAEANSYYVENIPFNKNHASLSRLYGAENGKEAQSGKYIHSLWMSALRNTCQQASAEKPQEVIIHNAYFFLPSNLLRQLGDMVSGKQACPHVHITILTNSPDTTDLSVVNVVAKYSLKALIDHLEANKNSQSATLSYHEYLPIELPHGIKPSLHSKVMLFGEDLFIGSANADVRSYMMDANNGLLIRNAPQLVQDYRQWFHGLIADTKRTQDRTAYLQQSKLDTWLAVDTQQIMQSMQKLIAPPINTNATETPAPLIEPLAERLQTLFKTIYRLSADSLRDDSDSKEAQRQFNALFKLI